MRSSTLPSSFPTVWAKEWMELSGDIQLNYLQKLPLIEQEETPADDDEEGEEEKPKEPEEEEEAVQEQEDEEQPEDEDDDDEEEEKPMSEITFPTLPQIQWGDGTIDVGTAIELTLGVPFADYSDFDDCVSKNQDKDDPEAYCADVKGKTDWAGRKLTLPHIGWNTVTAKPGLTLFRGISPASDFYFAHSFQVACEDPALASAWCDYGGEFVCGFEQGNIFAVQFHPEKSQSAGQRLLRNFVEHCAQRAAA